MPLVALPGHPEPSLSLLTRDATPEELIEAAALNHVDWFTAEATVAGGQVRCDDGLTFIHSPAANPDAAGEAILAFPRMSATTADAAIDQAVSEARQLGVRQVACWSLLPAEPTDLGARLVARGFQWGWQPHWMALDLSRERPADFPLPDGWRIALDDESDWDAEGLPYYDRANAARLRAHARRRPRRTYHFGARLGDILVGHSLLHVSTGPLGVAGLYAVGVVPDARNKGVGRAVSLAACQFARALGCRYVLLNAATHIYERLGFASLGYGQTWWMHRPALEAPPPSPALVAFTEAVGRGDTGALGALPQNALPADLDAALPCGMTPLEVAARLGQPRAAEWLLGLGASCDVIPLCDLGWRDRVPSALAARPDLASRRRGEWGLTPLHEAAARGDVELARWLLAAAPDLSIEDAQFHSTALGWARHLGREEIVRLIEAHAAG
ncbi:MAG TPA: GNAT family N-acetyltransferase [Armatimonadaceae bacterium]|nr:GNAT family N-acetyltransferase [Armatimonadaceae bacterium]